jgi:predicted metal-dependent hydrolase
MSTSHAEQDLPPHTVRVSRRARRIRLTMSARDGLVVVLPRHSDVRRVPRILNDHAVWIERARARVAERRRHLMSAAGPLPKTVETPAFSRAWTLTVRQANHSARVVEQADQLAVLGGRDDTERREALRRWASRAAKHLLVPLLEELAAEQGLQVVRVQIRAQRTRWGSCSRNGGISLNRDLIFLPRDLVRYVLLHELAHLRVHDHSPAFWAELQRREPRAGELKRALREAWRFVPPWALEDAPAPGGDA